MTTKRCITCLEEKPLNKYQIKINKWKEKYGEYEVLFIGDDEMTDNELSNRNHEFYKEQIEAEKNKAD